MGNSKTYTYCSVLPANYQSPYYYICDFEIKPGDIVVVPLRSKEKVGLVLEVNEYTEDTAPYPPAQTLSVKRIFGEYEASDLLKEKGKVDAERAIRFKSDMQLKKLSIKESLMKYSVGKEKIDSGKGLMKDILKAIPEKNEVINDMISDLSGGIILSTDGKTVTGYNGKKKKGKTVISIPSGVESIEDNAFLRVDIDTLIIPKELQHLGKYTLSHPYGYGPYDTNPKPIEAIVVEEGNPNYMSDGDGFYSIGNGQKKLLRLYNKRISTYIAPTDVTAFEAEAFSGCSSLEYIVLTDGVETFDEYSLPHYTKVKEVFLPKTVKHLRPKCLSGGFETWNMVSYRIDEENETLFRDEDSIYEVLDDGSYKLITCLYHGKGKVLFLDGTSTIGRNAFKGHKNISKIELPQSLKTLEEGAFAETSLQSVVIPSGVTRIESKAFYQCRELKSVQIDSQVEYIAEDAFQYCSERLKIKSNGSDKYFVDNNGIVKKQASLVKNNPADDSVSSLVWMQGKTFVHTGFSSSEEREFEQLVVANGGIIKSSTVLTTDYLIYNANYDHETTKLKRARELVKQGKDIYILTIEEWNSLLTDQSSASVDIFSKGSEDASTSVPVTTTGEKNGNDQKSVPSVLQKDYFKEFARKIVQTITEESVSSKGKEADRANFDEKNRKVSVILTFSQQSSNAEVVKERVACAETLRENDPISIVVKDDVWEVTSKNGKSLGELGWLMARQATPYLNFISVTNCSVASITPKSKRRANCKYALGSVKFDIVEQSAEGLSEEDLVTRTQFSYSVDEKEAHLIRWIGDASIKTALIPATIEGKPVITLHPGLFEPDMWTEIESHVENIVIADGIQRIEAEVLFHVQGLKKIVFPASINFISPDVFSGNNGEYRDLYLNHDTVYIAPAGSYAEKFLKEYRPDHYAVKALLVTNEDVEESEDDRKMMMAFNFEPSDSGITLKFKSYMLDGFKEKRVTVPNTIKGEPVKSFDIRGIPNFVECLSIPSNTTNLLNLSGDCIFYNNGQSLKKVLVAEDNRTYWSDGSAIFSKDRKCLLRFLSYPAKKYTVPEGTERLAEYSFAEMKNLETLILPSSLKSIAGHTFAECVKLADIQGLENIEEVGDCIFSRDDRLTRQTIPFERNSVVLIVGSKLLKYNDLSTKEIIVPDGITSIGDYAFGRGNDNDQVEVIRLPDSVREIGKSAFRGRSKLKRINIPNGVKEIRSETFHNCEALESLSIPASVEKIDLSAFPKYQSAGKYTNEEKCALKTIEIAEDNPFYCSFNGMLFTKDKSQILFIPDVLQKTYFSIPEGVKIINECLLFGNNTITELVLPESIEKIGNSSFSGCANLRKIVLPEGLEEIGRWAFSGCGKLETIIWPKKLKSIGDGAFNETGLTSVNLPGTITHIGSEAFAKTKLKTVTIPKAVRTLGWGAFSCTPEIVVYDTIDPEAKSADAAIDTINGNPNSLVGYVGMGPAWAMWECAANHRWVDYSIVVRSAESDEIKYKVWMGADESQRDYYCFLSSAWGHNATFAFAQLDEFFPKIRGKEHKIRVAKYRLEYPVNLSDAAKSKYESYLKKYS